MDQITLSRRTACAAIAASLGHASPARAADFPTRPVELVVPSSAGGGTGIVARAFAPWNTLQDFLAEARRRPGQVTVGNSGIGSIWHVGAAALEEKTGTQFLHVPYQGSAPGLLALIGGHVSSMVVSPGEATAHVQGGKLKILAVMAERRETGFPDAPTLKEQGIDLSLGNWRALAMPKATPQPVVDAVADLTRKIAADPAFREAIGRSNLGFTYAEPAEFEAALRDEREFFRHVTRNLQLN